IPRRTVANAVKRMRSPIAPAPPKIIALRRFSTERLRAAIPMTTALSPESTRSMMMMLRTAVNDSTTRCEYPPWVAQAAWSNPGNTLGTRGYHGHFQRLYFDYSGVGAPALRNDDAIDDRGGEQQRQIPEGKEEHLASDALAGLEIETDGEPEKDAIEQQRRAEVDRAEAQWGERDAEQRQTDRVDHDLPPRLPLAAHDRKHRHGGSGVIT